MNTMPSSILQSALWAEFQRVLGKKVHEESGDGWTFLAVLESTVLGRYLYCPHGPLAQDEAGFEQAVAALSRCAKAEGAYFVRLEPGHGGVETSQRSLTAAGLRKAPTDIQPQRTWMLDLMQDEKALLAGMRPTSRNLHRNIHKKGVTFDTSTDPDNISILLGFLHEVSDRAGFRPQSDTYLELAAKTLMPSGAAKLFIARLDGQPIAAALSYETGTTRAYAHAAASDEHRRLNAAIPLLVTMILDAKASGLTHFDMWGVSPEDEPEHPWAGFSRFKRSFGGFEVAYPGSWDLPVRHGMYRAYVLARLARGALRTTASAARTAASRARRYARRA
ncbi:hypothetical protein GCM10027403_23760 [Arthrobacter tecti]